MGFLPLVVSPTMLDNVHIPPIRTPPCQPNGNHGPLGVATFLPLSAVISRRWERGGAPAAGRRLAQFGVAMPPWRSRAAGLPPVPDRDPDELRRELEMVRGRGWALADEELAPGIRSTAAAVRDVEGLVAAMNVTVHAAETSLELLVDHHLPKLLRAASAVSADWALWQSRPRKEITPITAAPGH